MSDPVIPRNPDDLDMDLTDLSSVFEAAAKLLRQGDISKARNLFKAILGVEPRLPEPHLELAVIYQSQTDLENAIEHAREGLSLLKKGGQWTDELSSGEMRAHALNLLGELLVERAQQEDALFEPGRFGALVNEAVALFRQATRLDPNNERARLNAGQHRLIPPESSS